MTVGNPGDIVESLRPSVRLANRRAAERLDVLEPFVARSSCNARLEDGRWCPRPVARISGGPWSERRLCVDHLIAYLEHDRIVRRILSIAPRR